MILTKDRPRFLERAIRNLQQQTHQNLELLVIADGEPVSDLVASLAQPQGPTLRLIELPAPLPIGQKRNFGASKATGQFICHCDDDDLSHPGRIERQLSILRNSRKQVTATTRAVFDLFDGDEQYVYEGGCLGASLFYARSFWKWRPFSPAQIGEDAFFIANAEAAGQLERSNIYDLIRCSIHDGNTARRELSSREWTRLK